MICKYCRRFYDAVWHGRQRAKEQHSASLNRLNSIVESSKERLRASYENQREALQQNKQTIESRADAGTKLRNVLEQVIERQRGI